MHVALVQHMPLLRRWLQEDGGRIFELADLARDARTPTKCIQALGLSKHPVVMDMVAGQGLTTEFDKHP